MQEKADYFVAAPEVGARGTPHIQWYIAFKNQVRFTALLKKFKIPDDDVVRVRVFVKRGSNKVASDYCKKGEYNWVKGSKVNHEDPLFGLNLSKDTIEYGTLPLDQQVAGGKATEETWARNMELAIEGNFDEITPSHQVLHYKKYKEYADRKRPKPKRLTHTRAGTPNLWIYGPTGTGKSHYAREMYPDLYEKMPDKWWEDYEYQDVVLYEDLGHFEACYMGGALKIVGDIYPFRCHCKFGNMYIRPQIIIVTSNYRIRELFPDPNVYEPLEDRFKQIYRGEKYIPPEERNPQALDSGDQERAPLSQLVQEPKDAGSQGEGWFDRFEKDLANRPPYPMFPVVHEMARKYAASAKPFEVTRADEIPRGPMAPLSYLDSDSEAEAESESDINVLDMSDEEDEVLRFFDQHGLGKGFREVSVKK